MQKTSKILRIAAIFLLAGCLVVVTAWAFMAHLHPDRVGDFASFLQMCSAVLAW